ncbi:MAG TPA: bifunctional nuclease family protein [Firmicutes bacterium]|nr:bifunctional nuclease family protein [Bacillota bacterium]
MLLEMQVKTVTMDRGGSFIVLLTDNEEKKVLPISIGPFEAQSIALVLQGAEPPRPLSHDLLKTLCEQLGGMLEKIVVTDIRDSTFYAELYIRQNDQVIVIDSRPSDAIAFALRCGVNIFMEARLVEFTYDYDDLIQISDQEDGENEETH